MPTWEDARHKRLLRGERPGGQHAGFGCSRHRAALALDANFRLFLPELNMIHSLSPKRIQSLQRALDSQEFLRVVLTICQCG